MEMIEIRPTGDVGNQMLQLILAEAIASRSGGGEICGYDLPMWGLSNLAATHGKTRAIKIAEHGISGDLLVSLRKHLGLRIRLVSFFFDYEFFKSELPRIRERFESRHVTVAGYGNDTLLINVRGKEVLNNIHPDYGPLPFSYYEQLISRTGLKPVFMGQIGDDYYSNLLRERFPSARFVPSQGALHDFETIRRSNNIAISVSTFSWLAAWLSDAETIHFPVMGLFNPAQRPDINMLPVDDARYRFYALPLRKWEASDEQISALSHDYAFKELDARTVRDMLSQARNHIVLRKFFINTKLLVKGGQLVLRRGLAKYWCP